MASFWNSADRLILQSGLSIYREADLWFNEQTRANVGSSPQDLLKKLKLRPVVAHFTAAEKKSAYSLTFPSFGGRFLEPLASDLQQKVLKSPEGKGFLATLSVFFLLGSLFYHCRQLAESYTTTIRRLSDFGALQDHDRLTIQLREPFFEFDSLTTSCIRTLDASRYILWNAFGSSGTTPSSFRRVLDKATRIPSPLGDALDQAWSTHFSHAKEYRDCIQHYVAVGVASWGMLYRLDDDSFGLLARIPDNPEARSIGAFRFKEDRDALVYGWELASLTTYAIHAIIEHALGEP